MGEEAPLGRPRCLALTKSRLKPSSARGTHTEIRVINRVVFFKVHTKNDFILINL